MKTFATILFWRKTQAEENRQRVLVLENEWQALYDQAGEETDDKAEPQPSQGDLESDGMDATDDERIPLRDSDGFLTVLSREAREKQETEEAHDFGGTGEQEPHPSPQFWSTTEQIATCTFDATAQERGLADETGPAFGRKGSGTP